MVNTELPKYWLATHKNVSNEQECQEKYCQKDKQCTAFVYIVDAKICTLKKPPKRFISVVHLKKSTGKVFGPQFCPGNIYNKKVCLMYFLSCIVNYEFKDRFPTQP